MHARAAADDPGVGLERYRHALAAIHAPSHGYRSSALFRQAPPRAPMPSAPVPQAAARPAPAHGGAGAGQVGGGASGDSAEVAYSAHAAGGSPAGPAGPGPGLGAVHGYERAPFMPYSAWPRLGHHACMHADILCSTDGALSSDDEDGCVTAWRHAGADVAMEPASPMTPPAMPDVASHYASRPLLNRQRLNKVGGVLWEAGSSALQAVAAGVLAVAGAAGLQDEDLSADAATASPGPADGSSSPADGGISSSSSAAPQAPAQGATGTRDAAQARAVHGADDAHAALGRQLAAAQEVARRAGALDAYLRRHPIATLAYLVSSI